MACNIITEDQDKARWHDPDANITMPFGDMAIWDDEIPVGMVPGDEYINELTRQRELFYKLYERAVTQRNIWWMIAFNVGLLLGYGLSYV